MKVIVLAGGSGTRLFPLSRTCNPKQFLHITGVGSLFQQTIERFTGLAAPEDIVVVTNENYRFTVKQQLLEIHAEAAHIICEPVARNTAPAIAFAIAYCFDVLKCSRNEVLFVSPSDHLIRPADAFRVLVQRGQKLSEEGRILTFGIPPVRPETGYGYIHAGRPLGNGFEVESFKEKPDIKTAQSYLEEGCFYWNSGMFMFRADVMMEELAQYAPAIAKAAGGGLSPLREHFSALPDISIDYAVAEKSQRIAMLPMKDVYWNDIGSFDSISEVLSNTDGDAIAGDVLARNCKNTMILGSNRLICGIGLDDMMIVDTPDVLLVAKKGQSQQVKQVVNQLKKQKRKEVSENVTMYRPWGSYTTLAEGPGYKVKRLVINPGQKLSLQLHYHRSEHWTVISGTGKYTLGDKTAIFRENESTFIPMGVKHRLENPGKLPLMLIEVQTGKYIGEDDIVRFEDMYGRVGGK